MKMGRTSPSNNGQQLVFPPMRGHSGADAVDYFVPWDGDARLGDILAKAALLAADDQIKHASLRRQINE